MDGLDPAQWPELTLPQMLRRQAERQPRKVALRQKEFGIWRALDWEGYWRRSLDLALGLQSLGLGAGAHVAIVSENRQEWLLAQMGAGVLGAVCVGVYPTSPASEMGYVLEHAGVDLAICEDQEQADKVLAVKDRLPALRGIVMIETKGLRNYPPEVRQLILPFEELIDRGAAAGDPARRDVQARLDGQRLDEVGLMIYTSGSTGKPKGAMIRYANMRAVAPGIADRLEMDSETVHLSYLPLCHVAEQMLSAFVPIYLGAQVNFGESIRTVQEDLREVAPSVFLGVPRIWEKLHAAISIKMQETGRLRQALYRRALSACGAFLHKDRSQRNWRERLTYGFYYWLILRALQNFIGLRRVKVALTGAAPIPQEVLRYFRSLGVPLVEVYGLTESTGMVFGQRRQAVRVGTVGEPILGVRYRVGEHGELLLQGGMVFGGYYRNEEATAQAVRDGWLHTGDVAAVEDGQVRIVDRLKDIMITAGGKNLTPTEIEAAVKASPYVKECVAIGDGRRFVSALIQIEFDTVAKWAEINGIAYTHFRSLAEHPRVRDLVQQAVDHANKDLAQVARIKRFHLLVKELDHDDGEVTATMKVRRASIHQAYAAEIEALYRETA
ncbi:AMP-dependent synthetase/ligase [Bordetella hinzii]|uniref:Long-chain fatty acid--CoA ligase n=1 Tax=Bordetella hinzii TaxID=103855 RepID=A0AAN1S0D2_9BORD|nr:AMP-dependent synthetase/ligase [Bordetella hinzii]AKQ59781.1 Long-chain-fatty-acid--CoA ligase FadD15 [Bordetella hinzii]AZW19095.1 long-chain fatty acid--CoA ligase [Bordetella hinzii]KCB47654.1 AMP-binding enzyme [Bordetella hinzii 4161]KXA73558.1 long-chain fatty acid--CoA ligase [Bordetella hinzii LMG 13501]MBZ0073518.1 AMP-binding protein [Bordetella hinzii]